MTRRARARFTSSRRHVGALVVLLAIVFAAVYATGVAADNSLPAPGWALTAAPTENLVDGQQVTLNIKANPDVAVAKLVVRECRFGPTYNSDIDMDPDSLNCPPGPISSSQLFVFVERNSALGLATLARSDKGAAVPFFVGQGVATWNNPQGTTLTCDPTHPCALVAKVIAAGATTFQTTKLTFADSDPISACGGPASGILNTAAGDEISDAWSGWTKALCAKSTGGAPSRAAFTGEGAGVSSFAQGDVDLAYTSAGYSDTVGLSSIPAASRRAAVAIPLAVNASVIAAGGGQHQFVNGAPTGDKAPYADGSLQLNAHEVGAMLGGGQQFFGSLTEQYRGNVLARNPDLAGTLYSLDANIQAPSETLGSTYFMTNYLHTFAPDDFVDPTVAPKAQHLATASLALAQPNYNFVALFTGRPALRKVVIPASISGNDGPLWTMTDLGTARALGLTPAALPGAGGEFVSPTQASMQAAVAAMKADSNGVLMPDPSLAAGASAADTTATPYPLTYVIYALVPTEPLVDTTTCVARTESQALLTKWLTYVTGDGQDNLPAGMVKLPANVQQQAKDDLAKVGASPVTGACAGKLTAPDGTPIGSAGLGSLGNGISGPTSFASSGPQSFSNLGAPAGGAAGTANSAAGKGADTAAIAVPAFAGHKIANSLGGVVALVAIVLLTTLGAWITAGGELGGPLPVGGPGALTPGRIVSLAALWTVVGISGVALVMFQLGPMLEQRDQRSLLTDYKQEVSHAANESGTLAGVQIATTPPDQGSAVGILEVGELQTQDVVVEGVGSSETRQGPGHVPGTSGLGQPGNSVVVARRNGYGGSFAKIDSLRKGDRIVVTTTQGQSVYAVDRTCTVSIDDSSDDSSSTSSSTSPYASSGGSSSTTTSTSTALAADDICVKSSGKSNAKAAAATDGAATTSTPSTSTAPTSTTSPGTSTSTTAAAVAAAAGGSTAQPASATGGASAKTVKVDALYGPTTKDQLTLVTSASRMPMNSSQGTVVVAKLLTKPFAPTPQGGRSSTQTGLHGESGAWATVILAMMGFIAVVVASVFLYRRMRFRVAYVLTIAPLVALTVVMGETVIRLLPAWT